MLNKRGVKDHNYFEWYSHISIYIKIKTKTKIK